MGTLKRTGNNVLTRVLVIAFVVSFLIFFFDNVQTTYNSYKDLEKAIENSKLEKQIIENQIEEWNRQISDLDDPDKLELVTPIEEVMNSDRSKSVFEYVVEFIVGQEGG